MLRLYAVPPARVPSPCAQLHVKLWVVCTQCVECCQQVLHVLVLASCLVSHAAPQGGPTQSLGGPQFVGTVVCQSHIGVC